MLSRALSLATVMLLVGFATVPAQAQNLEAGKSPSQIFAGSCSACHKAPRGLLKTVAPGALPGFLRQHYTTSSDMASLLAAYVISNGATDTRYGGGGLTKQGKDAAEAKPAAAPPAPADSGFSFFGFGRKPAPEAAAPEPAPEPVVRRGRNGKRLRNHPETPEQAARPADGEPSATAEASHAPKQRHGKKGRRTREEPATPDAAKDEPKASQAPAAETPAAKPAEESKPAAVRADPVPAVTPAPKAADSEPRREAPASEPAPSAAKPAE